MPTSPTAATRDLVASQSGFARLIADLASLIDNTVEVFTEAFDLSSAARARFPSAD